MATVLKIEFQAKGRKFVDVKGCEINNFKPDFVSGSGWECHIRQDGSIKCDAIEEKDGEYCQTSYTIDKKGKVTITKVKKEIKHVIPCKSIPKWPTSGTIILSGGNVETRRGYFKKVTKKDNKEEKNVSIAN